MHIRRNNQIFLSPNCPQPMTVSVNGATISITTPEDALCYLYMINYPLLKNLYMIHRPLPKKDPKRKKKEFTYLRQEKFLFRYLEQLRRWIIMIVSRNKCPTAINVSWKVDQEKIISVAFGASISAYKETKEEIA